MSDNSIELSGIFSEGYGIIPKKLMRLKLDEKLGKSHGKWVKLVLGYMLSYTGAGNECFPAINTIAEDLEISRDTVIKAIKDAEKLYMITKSKLFPNDPLKKANKYRLDFLMNDPGIESRQSRITLDDGSTFQVRTFESNNNSINNNKNNNNKHKYPSLAEINNYVKEKNYNVDPEFFYEYFTVSNWIDKNGCKVKSWKQKLLTWHRHAKNDNQQQQKVLTEKEKEIKEIKYQIDLLKQKHESDCEFYLQQYGPSWSESLSISQKNDMLEVEMKIKKLEDKLK